MSTSNAALLNSPNISERIAARRAAYGGSDDTRASFNRPQYVQYNAISKSRDFGTVDNLRAAVSGALGAQAGTQTLFFKVTLSGAADVRIVKIAGNPREDQYISVGVIGPSGHPLPLDADGFATATDIYGTAIDESHEPLEAGTYWFTVSSSQWQQIPYAALLQVISYKEAIGTAGGSCSLVGRLALVKLYGTADGSAPLDGLIPRSSRVKKLEGAAGGSAGGTLTLVRPSGVAGGTLVLSGRLLANYRISGAAGGTAPLRGTLTVQQGGYGY